MLFRIFDNVYNVYLYLNFRYAAIVDVVQGHHKKPVVVMNSIVLMMS